MVLSAGLFFWSASAQAETYNKNLLLNSEFQDGLKYWNCQITDNGATFGCSDSEFVTPDNEVGGYYITLGGNHDNEQISQQVAIPQNARKIYLSYLIYFTPGSEQTNDYLKFSVCGSSCHSKTIYPNDIIQGKWEYFEEDISEMRGQNVVVKFAMHNDSDGLLSYAAVDDVKMRAKTYSAIKGRVLNSALNNHIVKRAAVRIATKNGRLLWKGKTNIFGRFKAGTITGGLNKKIITISKEDDKKTFRRSYSWGKLYKQKFYVNWP